MFWDQKRCGESAFEGELQDIMDELFSTNPGFGASAWPFIQTHKGVVTPSRPLQEISTVLVMESQNDVNFYLTFHSCCEDLDLSWDWEVLVGAT